MVELSVLQRIGLRGLMAARIWPHLHFTYSPFKILEFRELVDTLDWTGRERVLDIGCGAGLQTFLIGRRAGHTTGLDTDPTFIEQARWSAGHVRGAGRVDFEVRDLLAVGWPAATFDRIFSICVLEHIPHHRAIVAECARLLKPGGEIVFSVDTLAAIEDPDLRRRHRQDHGVVQYFTPGELRDLLAATGFADIRLKTLFRSDLARSLFARGIRRGFNFGRLRASSLASALAAAEAAAPPDAPGLFLAARARRP
ncbi:MAG TPA: methyltransferase domain-containing protein [Candidatus Krumholzibacteria bacterium]|nr:methyltransferase domain-containing protein [Candidatus Krumholzibacteria bacterium]HPD72690.1 methyltransferase domain-containing protein [Candidatus Krumholzibacteria bacterium]HRY40378.1 methyltransferase domain-containing protein [Candidatus Krumholzibacteria bacterium]